MGWLTSGPSSLKLLSSETGLTPSSRGNVQSQLLRCPHLSVPDARVISKVIRVTYRQVGPAYSCRHEPRNGLRRDSHSGMTWPRGTVRLFGVHVQCPNYRRRFHNANLITYVRRKNEGGSKLYKKFSIIELEPGQTSGLKWKKADRHRSGWFWYRSSLSFVAVMLCGVPALVAWTCALRPSAHWISGQILPVF